MRLDAHQHFWKYDAVEYDWINDEMNIIFFLQKIYCRI